MSFYQRIKEYFLKSIFHIYIIILIGLSVYPLGNQIPTNDKFNHLIGFCVYIVLFKLAYPKMNSLFLLISGIGLGILIEIIQSFVPYRQTEFLDVVADTVGLIIGFVLIKLWNKFLYKLV